MDLRSSNLGGALLTLLLASCGPDLQTLARRLERAGTVQQQMLTIMEMGRSSHPGWKDIVSDYARERPHVAFDAEHGELMLYEETTGRVFYKSFPPYSIDSMGDPVDTGDPALDHALREAIDGLEGNRESEHSTFIGPDPTNDFVRIFRYVVADGDPFYAVVVEGADDVFGMVLSVDEGRLQSVQWSQFGRDSASDLAHDRACVHGASPEPPQSPPRRTADAAQ